MYLKNLTVFGFKSFADKTSLTFQPGVTAIVGPNGCGKSNVADAIRWVLGEQSAKALRGGEMADVIFNGTDKRKQLALAEVSLTIGDVDEEHLRAAGVNLDFNELTITRRVFRDGGSEYFINKTHCRLKDIQQLFMGTGMGRTSYSIMAQGNITQVLSSKPDDRRLIFEEAAGITRYKAQKREALRKLDHTEQNLLRVSDLIREVKRQIGSLQRQAGKAKRYKKILDELKHLETQLCRHRYDVLDKEVRDLKARIEGLRTESETGSEEVLRGEKELAQRRERLSELEQKIHGEMSRGLELKSEIDRHEGRVQYGQERIRELEAQNARALEDIRTAEERRTISEEELAEVIRRLEASLQHVESRRAELETRRTAVTGVEESLRAQQNRVREEQSEAFRVSQELNKVRNELHALKLRQEGNVVRQEKLSSEKVQLEEERTRLEQKLTEFSSNVENEKRNAQASRGTVEERQKRLREIQDALRESSSALDELNRSQAGFRSSLNVLERLEDSREGFSEGAAAALARKDLVQGSLTDHIRVPSEFVVPVEAALGQQLQVVLTEDAEKAAQVLTGLTEGQRGRASIAPLRWQSSHQASQAALPDIPGVRRLVEVVEARNGASELIQRLLGRTLLVESLEAARQVYESGQGDFDFVTPDGDLLSAGGVFTGGRSRKGGKASGSILARKNEMEEIRTKLADLAGKIEAANKVRGEMQAEQTALQAGLQEAQSELRRQEVQIATSEGEFRALQNSLRVLHQKIDTVVYELTRLVEQDRESADRREALSTAVADLEAKDQEAQKRMEESNEALEAIRVQRDEAQSALSEIKVEVATEEQVAQSFAKQKTPLESRIVELGQLVESRHRELGEFEAKRGREESEISQSTQTIESLKHQREQVNAQIGLLREQKSGMEAEVSNNEESLRSRRARLAQIQEERGGMEVSVAEKQMSMENLVDKIQSKYQVDLTEVRGECITITITEEGGSHVEVLDPEELAAAGVATNWEEISARVKDLQGRIDAMGAVNLVAIEEYEETEQRYEFLNGQFEDLSTAKAQLMEVINKINTETRAMFLETFTQIRDNFRATFTEIFGGGQADLNLVDQENVLESGIEIMARPPGKRLQSISLLSGGEQTMTAVALLFAIYQVKPSPFCVLDELDAPLDESNINRFIKILQRFLEHSQFIIITHNKRTISIADVLYGVTMQEHGVSKIVSVKFHKSDEEGLPEAGRRNGNHAKPLVPPADGDSREALTAASAN